MTEKTTEVPRKILAAALLCLSLRGYAAINLRDIAREAGVALSQLNYYFHNKETLLLAVLASIRRDYVSHVESRLSECATARESFVFLIEYNRFLLLSKPDRYRLLLDFSNLALWSAAFRAQMNDFVGAVSLVIEHRIGRDPAVVDGVSAYPTAIRVRAILSASFGIAAQFLLNPDNRDPLRGFDLLLDSLPA